MQPTFWQAKELKSICTQTDDYNSNLTVHQNIKYHETQAAREMFSMIEGFANQLQNVFERNMRKYEEFQELLAPLKVCF